MPNVRADDLKGQRAAHRAGERERQRREHPRRDCRLAGVEDVQHAARSRSHVALPVIELVGLHLARGFGALLERGT